MYKVLRDSLIYIDYETLKLPETKIALDDRFIEILIRSKAKVIILFQIQQRLKKNRNSKNEKIKIETAEIEKLLNNIQVKSNKINVVGSANDKDEYYQIYSVCYRFIGKSKQAIITNNKYFANEILKINKQKAVRGNKISVLTIDKKGNLIEFI